MTSIEYFLLGSTGFFSSTLTAMVGFGGGSFLIGVMLLIMPPTVVIPFHGLVQLISNSWRVYLFRQHIGWPLVVRFVVLMPFGIVLGLWFFQGLSKEAIQMLIGAFVLISLVARHMKGLRGKDLPLAAFLPLGFVVGILNMMVGVVAPLLGVLVVRRELNKEGIIATLGLFALSGHIFKVIAFGLAGFRFQEHLIGLLVMIPAVLAGGLTGKWMLGKFDERYFMIVFQVLLVILSFKLIVWEGLLKLL